MFSRISRNGPFPRGFRTSRGRSQISNWILNFQFPPKLHPKYNTWYDVYDISGVTSEFATFFFHHEVPLMIFFNYRFLNFYRLWKCMNNTFSRISEFSPISNFFQFSNFPQYSNFPQFPNFPQYPNFFQFQNIPQFKNFPQFPNFSQFPNFPQFPIFSQFPNFPQFTIFSPISEFSPISDFFQFRR